MKTEFGDASGTAYFDVRTRTWSNAILDVIDDSGKLQDCLPDLIPPDAPVGTIRAEIAEQFQLNQDVLVSSGGGEAHQVRFIPFRINRSSIGMESWQPFAPALAAGCR
jgi:hypothetical protein